MKEHGHEEFVVVETNTVCNPRAVMVHFENALVALRAMMAPLRLGPETPLANADTTCELLSFN